MSLIPITCSKCGASIAADDAGEQFTCIYCNTTGRLSSDLREAPSASNYLTLAQRSFKKEEFGRAIQLIEEGLKFDPNHSELLALEAECEASLRGLSEALGDEAEKIAEAEDYHLQATLILNALQANIEVYGSNSLLTGANPADVDLGIRYVNRSLEHFPENAVYLNTKALLLAEGKGDTASAMTLLEKANANAPRDINIEQNLQKVKSNGCFVATAALGNPNDPVVIKLRAWRDDVLLKSETGTRFVEFYYRVSPGLSKKIESKKWAKDVVRSILTVFVKLLR